MRRREFLSALAALALEVKYPAIDPRHRLEFPRDHGAHPDFRTEWWYLTGWLSGGRSGSLGFQVTFFRSRPPFDSPNPSAFAPRQVLLAHAALADPRLGRLQHDQRAARHALGVAGSEEHTTRVWIDDWQLRLSGNTYRTAIAARDFSLELECRAPQSPLLQGENGFSRKGSRPGEASHYYSRPQLAVTGRVNGEPVSGTAWLDHEWSSSYLAPEAAGWDWVGLNLADGGALMAFRMRARKNGVHYAGGTLASGDGKVRTFAPDEIAFEPLHRWRSPRTGVEYPIALRVRAGGQQWELAPLMDDQELDARTSTGTIYWEGAVRASAAGAQAGRGYLELTGYWKPMRF